MHLQWKNPKFVRLSKLPHTYENKTYKNRKINQINNLDELRVTSDTKACDIFPVLFYI